MASRTPQGRRSLRRQTETSGGKDRMSPKKSSQRKTSARKQTPVSPTRESGEISKHSPGPWVMALDGTIYAPHPVTHGTKALKAIGEYTGFSRHLTETEHQANRRLI